MSYLSHQHSPKEGGFSLTELVIVMAILAIITTLSIPSLRDYFTNARLRSGADTLQAAFNKASQDAVKTNTAVTVVVSSDKIVSTVTPNGAAAQVSTIILDSQIKITGSNTLPFTVTFETLRAISPSPAPFMFEPTTGSCPSACPKVVLRASGSASTCLDGVVSGYNACN